MNKWNEMIEKYGKRNIAIAGGCAILTVAGVAGFFAIQGNKTPTDSNYLTLKSDQFAVEYGYFISQNVADYLVEDTKEEVLTNAKVKVSAENEKDKEYPAIGTYDGNISYEKEKVEFKVEVKDTTAPTFSVTKNLTVPFGTEMSEKKLKSYFKVEDLQEVTLTVDDGGYNPKKEGKYIIKAKATDKSNNIAEYQFTITVDKKVKEIIESENKSNVTTHSNTGNNGGNGGSSDSQVTGTVKPGEKPKPGGSGNVSTEKPSEKPTEPSKPEKPTEPSKPEKPTEPSKPEKPTEPSKPEKPTEPSKPEKPTEPSKPEKPTEPSKPTEPPVDTSQWWQGKSVAEIREKVTSAMVWENEVTGELYYGLNNLAFGWNQDGIAYGGLKLVKNPYNVAIDASFTGGRTNMHFGRTTFNMIWGVPSGTYNGLKDINLGDFTVKVPSKIWSTEEVNAIYRK